jgi:hypothetical protein
MSEMEDALPDDAATLEALAELERLDAAEAPPERPAPPRAYVSPANRPLPPPPEKPFWHDGPAEKAPRVGKVMSLEDLCSTYHAGLADGTVFLRVDRKEPKAFRGVRTAGYIKDIYTPTTTPEFAEMFGGGKYSVTAFRESGPGESTFKPSGTIEIQIPGNPTTDTLPEDEMTGSGRVAAPVYGGEPAQVAEPVISSSGSVSVVGFPGIWISMVPEGLNVDSPGPLSRKAVTLYLPPPNISANSGVVVGV